MGKHIIFFLSLYIYFKGYIGDADILIISVVYFIALDILNAIDKKK